MGRLADGRKLETALIQSVLYVTRAYVPVCLCAEVSKAGEAELAYLEEFYF